MDAKVRIRRARPDDVPAIRALIRELAGYEKLLREVRATAPGLRRALFGPRPCVDALVAEGGGRLVGYALHYRTFSSFAGTEGVFLEDLYVQPAWRGRGVGSALLRRVAQVAARRGCARLEWIALDWNAPALRFYRRIGAKARPDWVLHRWTAESFGAFARRAARPAVSRRDGAG
jgi:GNAT superfamily N-acetyltransferase